MMKFFRKYNRHLLAVFMALLLVVWLGGSALTSWLAPNQAAQIMGTAFGSEISAGQVQAFANETVLMDLLGLAFWRNPGQNFAALLEHRVVRLGTLQRLAPDLGILTL